jgi:hypothetical protein
MRRCGERRRCGEGRRRIGQDIIRYDGGTLLSSSDVVHHAGDRKSL